jgi:hypothetical protein
MVYSWLNKIAKGDRMKRLALAVSLILLSSIFAVAQNKLRLTEINKVYIGDLGREEGSDLVREKIRVRLMKSARFIVVETQDAADAVLTGVAGVERRHHSSVHTDSSGNVYGSGGTSYAGIGVLRLVDLKSQETIWLFEYKRGFRFGSASSRVADKTVDKLLKDAKEADKKVGKASANEKQ